VIIYDDIIRMAGHREVTPWVLKLVQDCIEAEREACAKVCDGIDRRYINQADKCAAAIRERGENF